MQALDTALMDSKTKRRPETPFAERMVAAREHAAAKRGAALSQMDVQRAVGIKQGTLSDLEKNGQGSTWICRLARFYGVRPEWLEMGEEPMVAPAVAFGPLPDGTSWRQIAYQAAEGAPAHRDFLLAFLDRVDATYKMKREEPTFNTPLRVGGKEAER